LKPVASTVTELFTVTAEKLTNEKCTIKPTTLFLDECSTWATDNSSLIWQQS
jgi:hypothetical protein